MIAEHIEAASSRKCVGFVRNLCVIRRMEVVFDEMQGYRVLAGRVPVLVDGGIRRGTDILKALALGANAVLIGRPYVWGLGAEGETGVRKVVNILRREFEIAMALAGRTNVASIDRSVIWSWLTRKRLAVPFDAQGRRVLPGLPFFVLPNSLPAPGRAADGSSCRIPPAGFAIPAPPCEADFSCAIDEDI